MDKNQFNSQEKDPLARKIKYLEMPERREAFPPEKLLQMLPVKKTDNILDLGAGTGYLAIPAAQMVDGLVYALDIDHHMLTFLDSKAKDEKITNIELVKASIDSIPLPDVSVDIVLASLILHEVESLPKALREIKRVLKEGGYFVCFEFEKTESPIDGPPMHIRIPSLIMEKELLAAGFHISQKLFPEEYLYIFIVQK